MLQEMRRNCHVHTHKALATRLLFILTRCSRMVALGMPLHCDSRPALCMGYKSMATASCLLLRYVSSIRDQVCLDEQKSASSSAAAIAELLECNLLCSYFCSYSLMFMVGLLTHMTPAGQDMRPQVYTNSALFATQPRLARPPEHAKPSAAGHKRLLRRGVSNPPSPLARSITLPSRSTRIVMCYFCS